MIIKQLTVFLENKSGRLAEVTKVLAKNNINMTAFSIADTADFGILRLVVNNPDKALQVLKEAEFSVGLTDVLCIVVPNKPGGLSQTLEILSNAGIAIDYLYAFALCGSASVVIRTNDIQKTLEILQKSETKLHKADEIYKI